MKIKTVNLKALPYKTEYFVTESEGNFGLRLIEYYNDCLTTQKIIPNLTTDAAEINRIIHLLSDNGVFAAHAEHVLEDLGFAI